MAEKRPKRRNATSFPKGSGAGKGDGWGGPARGASASRIKPGDPDGIQRLRNNPEIMVAKEKRGELVREHLFCLALGAGRQETQVAAAVAYLNRTEGMPVARNVNIPGDASHLTDAELAAIAATGRAAPDTQAGDPPEPGDLVH